MSGRAVSSTVELLDRLRRGDELTVAAIAESLGVDQRAGVLLVAREARCNDLELKGGRWRRNPLAWKRLPAGFPVAEYLPPSRGRPHVLEAWMRSGAGVCWCNPASGGDWGWCVVHRDPASGVAPWPATEAAAATWTLVVEDWPDV